MAKNTNQKKNNQNIKGELEMKNTIETVDNAITAETADNMTAAETVDNATAAETVDNMTVAETVEPEQSKTKEQLLAEYQAIVKAMTAAGITIPNPKKGKAPVDDSAVIAEIEQFAAAWTPTEFSKRVKVLSNDGVEQLAKNAGVRLWEDMLNPSIRRMRQLMEVKAAYYPAECGHLSAGSKPKKTNGGFTTIDTAKLLDACKAKGLAVNLSTDDKINRMRAIMLLKAVGITPESLTAESLTA